MKSSLQDTLVIIPARGGSKGVHMKNIKLLAGKPLISYSLYFASEFFDKEDICVSTDSLEIKDTVGKLGYNVPFIRPDVLATDTATTRDVLLHAVENFNNRAQYKYILLLQPTSPFRSKDDFEQIMRVKETSDFDMIVSVKETKSNPYFNLFEEENGILKKSKQSNFTRRQDAPAIYEFNGSFYLIKVESLAVKGIDKLEKILKVVNNNDFYNIDIDTEKDWQEAEKLIFENLSYISFYNDK